MKKDVKRIFKREQAAPGAAGLLPGLKKEVRHLLTSEEAKVAPGGVVIGAIALMGLGYCSEALAGHINQHQNWGAHGNYWPHHSVDCGHDNAAIHHSASPHVSVTPHSSAGYPHTNSHANVNEAVTKGTMHNNVADGYGKHTASLGHNNNPNTHVNTSGHYNTAPHFNYAAHSSTAPHMNFGHHVSFGTHHSATPHFSKHQNGHWNG